MATEHVPQLLVLPTPAGREPIPQTYAPGAEVFQRAYDEALKGKYEKSAESFLEAAQILTAPRSHQFANSMQVARAVSYHNAWEGFVAADKEDAGKAKLEKAAKADEANAAEIKKLLNS